MRRLTKPSNKPLHKESLASLFLKSTSFAAGALWLAALSLPGDDFAGSFERLHQDKTRTNVFVAVPPNAGNDFWLRLICCYDRLEMEFRTMVRMASIRRSSDPVGSATKTSSGCATPVLHSFTLR